MSENYTSPELLARRLDQALPPNSHSHPTASADPLVNVAAALAQIQFPILSATASAHIESRMLDVFDARYRATRRPRPVMGFLRLALVASLVMALLIASLTPAVAGSVPGEALYAAKQAYESIELALAGSPAAQASVRIQQANRRAQEALTLLERGEFNPDLIRTALANVAEATANGDSVETSPRLRGEVLQAQSVLSFVLNDAARIGLISSESVTDLLQQVDDLDDNVSPRQPDEGAGAGAPALTEEPTAAPMVEPTLAETRTPTDVPTVVPSPTATLVPSATPTLIPSPTETLEPTLAPSPTATLMPTLAPSPTAVLRAAATAEVADLTPTCEHGKSCLSQGVPGQAQTPTPRPTRIPQGKGPDGNNAGGNSANVAAPNSNAGGNSANAGTSNAGGNSGNSNAGGNSGNSDGGGNSDNSGGSGSSNGNEGNSDNGGNSGNSGGSDNGNSDSDNKNDNDDKGNDNQGGKKDK